MLVRVWKSLCLGWKWLAISPLLLPSLVTPLRAMSGCVIEKLTVGSVNAKATHHQNIAWS